MLAFVFDIALMWWVAFVGSDLAVFGICMGVVLVSFMALLAWFCWQKMFWCNVWRCLAMCWHYFGNVLGKVVSSPPYTKNKHH